MLIFETSPKRQAVKPTPLTFAEDARALKIINELIALDETWLDNDNDLLQRFVDNYQYHKNKQTKKTYLDSCGPGPKARKNKIT